MYKLICPADLPCWTQQPPQSPGVVIEPWASVCTPVKWGEPPPPGVQASPAHGLLVSWLPSFSPLLLSGDLWTISFP